MDGDVGIQPLSSKTIQAVSGLKFLEHVDFSDCLCRDEGSIEIVKKLVASKSPLRVLNLAGNEITPEAARTIMKLVKGIRTLEQVVLGTNCFGSKFDELRGFKQQLQAEYIDLGAERYVTVSCISANQ